MKTDYLTTPLKTRLVMRKAMSQHTSDPIKGESYSHKWGGQTWCITGTRTFARWHEAPRNNFRFVGEAHDILSLRHTGWYLENEPFQDETTHGLVFMLTHNRYLAAGSDPNNEGSAYFEVHENGTPYIYDSKEEAARNADRLAEIYAESAREDAEKFQEELRLEEATAQAQELTEAFAFPC